MLSSKPGGLTLGRVWEVVAAQHRGSKKSKRPSSAPYDCHSGFNNWRTAGFEWGERPFWNVSSSTRRDWSGLKKDWCCSHYKMLSMMALAAVSLPPQDRCRHRVRFTMSLVQHDLVLAKEGMLRQTL